MTKRPARPRHPWNRKHALVLPLLLCAALFAPGGRADAGVSPSVAVLDRSTAGEIAFRVRLPEAPAVEVVTTAEGERTLVSFPGGTHAARPGEPDLPAVLVRVAVPAGATLDLSASGEGERSVPLAHPLELLPALDPRGDETARPRAVSNGALPLAEIISVGEFRGVRVAGVIVRPVRLDEGRAELRIASGVRVRIAVSGGARTSASSAAPAPGGADRWVDELVLNPESARSWRTAAPAERATSAAGAADYFDLSRNWLRVEVTESGLYRITYQDFLDAGVDPPELIRPQTLRLFNGGGLALPESLSAPRRDWMDECAIEVTSTGGSFLPGDEVHLYALGREGWAGAYDPDLGWDDYAKHPFSKVNVYWLTWEESGDSPFSGTALRFDPPRTSGTTPAPLVPDAFQEHLHFEVNSLENWRSPAGDGWYWSDFEVLNRRKSFRIIHPGARLDRPVRVRTSLVSHAEPLQTGTRYFFAAAALNSPDFTQRLLGTMEWSVPDTWQVAIDTTGLFFDPTSPETSSIWVALSDSCRDDSCATSYDRAAYMDWIDVHYWRDFAARGNRLLFGAPQDSTGRVDFHVTGFTDTTGLQLLDVTRPEGVTRLGSYAWAFDAGAGSWTLTARDSLLAGTPERHYLAQTGFTYRSPSSISLETLPSGLDGEDLLRRRVVAPPDSGLYLIVTHASLLPAARSLQAHRRADGFDVEVVTTQSVMDEFGWGLMDPTALRDFALYVYQNWRSDPGTPDLRYLMLLGDTSKDFLDRDSAVDPILVPSYEQRYLLPRNETSFLEADYADDDWYAYTTPGDSVADFSIGRLPVKTLSEAQALVDRTIAYEADPEWGEWRKRIILAADDELRPSGGFPEAFHTRDTETLADEHIPADAEIDKVYETEYPLRAGLKPDATAAMQQAIDEGALFLNYIGHGDETRLADERLLEWDGIWKPRNGGRRPIMVILSCSVGKFDIPLSGLAELMLLEGEGGISAAFTSTFLAFPTVNRHIAQRFYDRVFETRPVRRLGEAALLAKTDVVLTSGSGALSDMERYAVLGDPALEPAWPRRELTFDMVTADTTQPDSARLVRRGHAYVSGHLVPLRIAAPPSADTPASPAGFDGEVSLLVRASADTSGHDYGESGHISYSIPGPPIFWGSLGIADGQFGYGVVPGEGEFVVAADAPAGGLGRASVYAVDRAAGEDAVGSLDSIIIGGLAVGDEIAADSTGPAITLLDPAGRPLTSGDTFVPGGDLTAVFEDPHGVNATGTDPFYTLSYRVDGGDWIDLTHGFRVDAGGFTRGRVSFALPSSVEPGRHTLELRGADNLNNRSLLELDVVIATDATFRLERVFGYPNPFRHDTIIVYELTREAEVTARIHTAAGRLIRTLREHGVPGQNTTLRWDGRDEAGDPVANGVYFVQVEARESDGGGGMTSVTSRLARIR